MKRFPFVIFLTSLISACTVGPNFKTPTLPTTLSYTSENDVLPVQQHIALGKKLETQWWTLFTSKSLNEAIQHALTHNYTIAATKETLAQAQEAVNAENGLFSPQIAFGSTAGRQKYGVALFGPSDFTIPPFTYFEAGPTLNWTPDLFGGTQRRVEYKQALAEYQAHTLDAAYVTLTGNVVMEILEIASATSELKTIEHIIAEDQNNLKLMQTALTLGAGTQMDVLAAQNQLHSDQSLLPSLKQRLAVAYHALSILLGKAPAEENHPQHFTMSDFMLPKELPVSLPSELVRKRPDILAAEANLHAASATIGIATANLYPNITLSATYLQEALTPHGLLEAANKGWAFAASLTAPVFSGGTLTAEKREAEHAYQTALAQYKETILHAFGQVADALTALAHDAEAVHTQQQHVSTDLSTLALVRTSYTAGNTDQIHIHHAKRDLAKAELELIRAQHQRYIDTTRLFVALGGSPIGK